MITVLIDHLPWALRTALIKRFFVKHNVSFEGVPSLEGPWPGIRNDGRFSLGVNCSFRSFRLRDHITVNKEATLQIGNNVRINDGVNICATRLIKINDYTRIADMVYIYDTDFHEISPDKPAKQLPVVIGRNVWIGTGSMILSGSSIGDHSIIAAGSVVVGDIPPKSIAIGSPAQVKKTIDVPDDWIRK